MHESRNEVNYVSFLVDCRDTGLRVDVKLPSIAGTKEWGAKTTRRRTWGGGVNSSSNSVCVPQRSETSLNPSARHGALHSHKANKTDLAFLEHDKGLEEDCVTGGVEKGRASFCGTSKKAVVFQTDGMHP